MLIYKINLTYLCNWSKDFLAFSLHKNWGCCLFILCFSPAKGSPFKSGIYLGLTAQSNVNSKNNDYIYVQNGAI